MANAMTSAGQAVPVPRRGVLTSISAFALTGALAGCSWSDLLNAAAPKGQTKRVRDVAYGPDERHRLDHYVPATEGLSPAETRGKIVFFHGGSWRTGSKDDYAFVGYRLAEEGYETIVPNYRLVPSVRFPAFVDDAARVVAWASQNSRREGEAGSKLFVVGHSAGAHIAALVSLDPSYLAKYGTEPRAVVGGWVGLSGPYDFLPFSSASVAEVFEKVAPEESQPISKVQAGVSTPPALLITGTDDTTVLPKNSRNLAKAIQDAGGEVKLITYDGIGHAGTLLAFGPTFASRAPVLEDLGQFVALKTGAS